ncbi:monocarboxylate transporter 13-like [Oculina patagonica]
MKDLEVKICTDQCDEVHEPRWRPDSCWSWLVCAGAVTSFVVVSGISYSFGLLLPPFMEHFEATRQETAWIGTMYLGCSYLLSLLASYLTDRFSYRFTAILGSMSGIIGFTLASWSSKLWMMYLTYGFLSGFGHAMISNVGTLVILQYFVKWRSVAVGIVASAPAIGMFLMTRITESLLTTFGWQGALRGYAILFLVCGLCATLYVPLDKEDEESNDIEAEETRKIKTSTLSLLRNRSFVILLISSTIVHLSYFVPAVHIVKHCIQELHIPEIKASMLYTYMAITSFISRNLFCKLGDFRIFNRFHLYQGGMTVSGLCVLCLPLARSFTSVVAIFMIFGLMEGTNTGQASLLVLECVGKHKVNQAWGYIRLFAGVSVCIGPPLAGLMADKLGSYTVTFYTAGAILIAGASITSLMAFIKQQPQDAGETQFHDEQILVADQRTVL